MVVFPNCKINLGLNIIRKRSDGYHDLETVFYPIALRDALEIIMVGTPRENIPITTTANVQFSISGFPIDGKNENNLCISAYQLLKKDFPQLPQIKMHLHKAIPTNAGLGGGSADGAFTLNLLNQIFNLGLTIQQSLQYTLQLGSDCPFFMINKPCLGTGRGEILDPIKLDLSAYTIVIVHPEVHINTTEAFLSINTAVPSKSVKNIINQPVATWRKELKNDFEGAIFTKYPEIKTIKETLYEAGATYASMTGSGSTVFGLFEKTTKPHLAFPTNYLIRKLPGQLE